MVSRAGIMFAHTSSCTYLTPAARYVQHFHLKLYNQLKRYKEANCLYDLYTYMAEYMRGDPSTC